MQEYSLLDRGKLTEAQDKAQTQLEERWTVSALILSCPVQNMLYLTPEESSPTQGSSLVCLSSKYDFLK